MSLLCELFARKATIHVGAFAIFKTDTLRVGEVSMFVRVADNEFCVLSKWDRAGGCSDFARYMFVEGASILIPVTALECPVTHRLSDDRRSTCHLSIASTCSMKTTSCSNHRCSLEP